MGKEKFNTAYKEPWEEVVQGNDAAFENVFNAHYKSMYGYGLKLCNRSALVKDCIQDLWMDIWERRTELHHVRSPNVYLFVSLRRKILKKLTHLRKLNGLDDDIEAIA